MSTIALPPFDPQRRFGAHMPTAGGLHNALYAGRDAGCDVVQVFTKSPQQWKAREHTDEQVEAFLAAQAETGIPCLASHDTYLINPCSADPENLRKSREALAEELVRSSRLRIPYVVMHLGTPREGGEAEAGALVAESVRFALERAPADGSVLLLETMAGQGRCYGRRFEELARVLDAVDAGERLGVCLDTCHIFAAGYDLRDREACAASLDEFDRVVGLGRVKLIHANDSRRELGSCVDRHEAIGRGCIGFAGFEALLRDPRLQEVPVVLETPKADNMDPVNLAALRRAAGQEGDPEP